MITSVTKKIQRGFTLIELLVVISIISLLSSIVLASLGSARNRAKNIAFTRELLALRDALNLYRLDNNGELPSTRDWATDNNSMVSLLEPLLVDTGYISKIPLHPDFPANEGEVSLRYSYAAPGSGASYYFGCDGLTTVSDVIANNGVLFIVSEDVDLEIPLDTGLSIAYRDRLYDQDIFGDSNKVYCLPL